ncbi:MAG: hypothetical protein J6J12_04550 [Oscillospiraceae bacterium]|nr:hypothetical protein [Oscillospiraceae bacterium]
MKQYAMMDTTWGKFLFGVFLFAMLLLARDTLVTSCLIGFTKSQFLMLGLICVFGLVFVIYNRKHWKQILLNQRMVAFGISALVLLVPMVGKRDWQIMYFSILLCLFFAVFLTYLTSWQTVAKYYVVILAVLGLYSLVGMYLLKPQAMAGVVKAPVFVNSTGMEFYNFGLTFVVTWEFWHRNFGIFREPGVYQFFLILGIYLNHYGVSWKREWYRWLVTAVMMATMLSTFAIGGFIELGLLAVFLYFDKHYYRTKPGKILGTAVVAAMIALVCHVISEIRKPYFEYTVYYEFYDMFRRLTTDSDSLVDRLDAIFTSMTLFFRHPLLGETIANVLHGTTHNTSSTLILFSALGIAGGVLHVASWVSLTWKRERNVFGNLFLLMILFMSFNTQNLTADVFFWLFPYMALTEALLPKLKLPGRKV